MDFILYAVPFFFALIALELLADHRRGVSNYRVADAINSISTGVLSTTTGLLTKGIGLVTYAFAFKHLALFELSADSVWTWVFAFVFYDFCYYWLHRLGHERNILWAAHSVHHQSEDYNLSTALRQTSTGFLLGWIFYLPMAVFGVPLLVFVSVAALNLLYQFWVHTRHIPKLGWFEWFFVTPSNHRAHHAQNALYMDRNYGGVFIIWDRLFGSFQEEDDNEPVVFGVTTPLASWNPLWANVQFYAQLWADARRAESTWDKLDLVHAHGLAPGGRGGQIPDEQAGPEPVPQIRGAAGRSSAALRPVAVLRLYRTGQLLDESRTEAVSRRPGAGLGGGGIRSVCAGRGPGESPVGVEAGAGAAGVESAIGMAGPDGGAVAGQRVGLGRPAQLQPVERHRSLLLQKPNHSVGVVGPSVLVRAAFRACSSA